MVSRVCASTESDHPQNADSLESANSSENPMHIQLNGAPHECADATTVAQLLHLLNLGDARVAVERNAMIVPRSRFEQETLHERDQVEIVRAIGGG